MEKKYVTDQATRESIEATDICNACSTTDCTGLMQRPPMDEAELDSYKELYRFSPSDIVEPKDKAKITSAIKPL